jgi:ABC-type polysaccharide/polyol phosphate export permease
MAQLCRSDPLHALSRFKSGRDLLVQIGFFVTPVLWKAEFVPEPYRELVTLNPFTVYLSIIRDPLLGEPVPLEYWALAIAFTVGGFFLSLPFIGRYHRRLVYWL